MKKKTLLTSLLALTLLASCSNGASSSTNNSSENSSSDNPTTSETQNTSEPTTSEKEDSSDTTIDSTTSEEIDSNDTTIDSSTSEEVEATLTSITEVRKEALLLKDQVNESNVAYSDTICEVTGKLLGVYDAITSKKDYGSQYKLLIANEEGYIYVKVDQTTYSIVKSDIGKVFTVKGNLSLYCNEPEIILNGLLKENSSLDVNVDNLFANKNSILEVYDELDKVEMNIKGCGFSSLVKFKAKLIAKMDDKVMLFYDGKNIIQGHNSDYKVFNTLRVGTSYEIEANVQMYRFKPGVEVLGVSQTEFEVAPIDKTKLEVVDNTMYKVKAKTESKTKLPEYNDMFKELKLFKGYANSYQKDSNYYIVLDTVYNPEYYNSYTAASSKEALFVKNDSCTRLFSDIDFLNCPFNDYLDGNYEIDMVVAPYLWNSSNYWQVYVLEDTINLLNPAQ